MSKYSFWTDLNMNQVKATGFIYTRYRYSANLLDQHQLTITCSAKVAPSRILHQTRKLTSHKSHIPVWFFIFPMSHVFSIWAVQLWATTRNLWPRSPNITRLLPSWFATRLHIPLNSRPSPTIAIRVFTCLNIHMPLHPPPWLRAGSTCPGGRII